MDVVARASNNLVSEQAASLVEAVEEHSSSCYGAQQGSPSGWLDPPIERRFQFMEGKFQSLSDKVDQILEEMARSRKNPEPPPFTVGCSSMAMPTQTPITIS